MRRGSVVGPLILIIIGGLFLFNNIHPGISILSTIANYWPFLLIIWDFLRLIEILFNHSRVADPRLRQHGVSGGEWVLVVFLCIIGSGAFFVHRNASLWSPDSIRWKLIGDLGDVYDYPIDEKKVAT